jgi:hypothetical protein
MSLLDALLNEGYRDPREVYIALRADGQKGSGTVDDPYDGGTRNGTPVPVNLAFNAREAVVTVQAAGHCFAAVQAVEITGFSGADAALFNGDFQATRLSSHAFKITLAQAPTTPPRHSTYFPHLRCTRKPIALGSLTYQLIGGQYIATARTAVAHGYCHWDLVEIADVTGSTASYFNGTFNITVDPAKPDEFTYKLPGDPGAGPGGSPVSTDKAQLQIRVFWPVASAATSQGQAHDLAQYDAVTIAGASVTALNTSFIVVAAGDTSFHYWLKALPSDGATATGIATRIIHRFDEVMRSLPPRASVIVHLGPGTFETRGLSVAYLKDGANNPDSVFVGFSIEHGPDFNSVVRSGLGMRVVGSGIGATTVKLVYAVDPLSQTVTFGNYSYFPVLHFQASDFTVDCNLQLQPAPHGLARAAVTVGAIAAGSRFNRLSRVRAINAGTQAIPESFVLFLSGHYSDPEGAIHNVIEDCIVEWSNETTPTRQACLAT